MVILESVGEEPENQYVDTKRYKQYSNTTHTVSIPIYTYTC